MSSLSMRAENVVLIRVSPVLLSLPWFAGFYGFDVEIVFHLRIFRCIEPIFIEVVGSHNYKCFCTTMFTLSVIIFHWWDEHIFDVSIAPLHRFPLTNFNSGQSVVSSFKTDLTNFRHYQNVKGKRPKCQKYAHYLVSYFLCPFVL